MIALTDDQRDFWRKAYCAALTNPDLDDPESLADAAVRHDRERSDYSELACEPFVAAESHVTNWARKLGLDTNKPAAELEAAITTQLDELLETLDDRRKDLRDTLSAPLGTSWGDLFEQVLSLRAKALREDKRANKLEAWLRDMLIAATGDEPEEITREHVGEVAAEVTRLRLSAKPDRARPQAATGPRDPGYYYLGWGPVVHVARNGKVRWHGTSGSTHAYDIDDWGPRIPDYDAAEHEGMHLAWVRDEQASSVDESTELAPPPCRAKARTKPLAGRSSGAR